MQWRQNLSTPSCNDQASNEHQTKRKQASPAPPLKRSVLAELKFEIMRLVHFRCPSGASPFYCFLQIRPLVEYHDRSPARYRLHTTQGNAQSMH